MALSRVNGGKGGRTSVAVVVMGVMVLLLVHLRQDQQRNSLRGWGERRSRHVSGGISTDVGHNIDVAVCGFRIWTLEVRAIHQSLCDFGRDAREVDVEASLQQIPAAGC